MRKSKIGSKRVISRKRNSFRGLWLRTRRFSVYRLRLRLRFFPFFRFFRKLKFPYVQAMKLVKIGVARRSRIISSDGNKDSVGRRRVSITGAGCSSSRSCACTSSFYSDAISDCLEFIKMSGAVSRDDSSFTP